ncbi:Clp protease N-terminal domain-containing protein [Leifsonia sp. NPDC058248]|uniref:Clp protease N-terminal domain-containing protein n=1 Tax=Leifsonia sp. NPDC058248 TaxID=3346402 RepID=UPI0036DC86D6
MADTADTREHEHDDRRLSRALRTIIIRAVSEAQRRGASLVEAEHLLLSLSLETGGPTATALSASGLDHAGIERVLRAERERSLEAAGVAPIAEERLAASPRVARPRWGASAREVLVRAHRAAALTRRKRTAEVDLLSGILGLELGTVPRALDLAGVDRHAILVAAATP